MSGVGSKAAVSTSPRHDRFTPTNGRSWVRPLRQLLCPKAEVQVALTPIAAGLQRLSHRCISLLLVEERPRRRKRGASCRATRTRSRRGRPSEYAVDLGGHDEVVLMQSLDLLGLQRDRRIAPTEADIRMMAFGFREFTNLLNK